MNWFYLMIALYTVMSLIAYLLYGADKRKAKKHKWRIPEAVLLGAGFFGGAVGALIGMRAFRHKTKHWYFWAVNLLAIALHAVILWKIYEKTGGF